jgi:hypothetical protein
VPTSEHLTARFARDHDSARIPVLRGEVNVMRKITVRKVEVVKTSSTAAACSVEQQ